MVLHVKHCLLKQIQKLCIKTAIQHGIQAQLELALTISGYIEIPGTSNIFINHS